MKQDGKLRIALFLWWFEIGGTERHALRLVRGLLSEGHEVDLFCFKASGSLADDFRELGCGIIELRKPTKIRSLFFPFDLYSHLRKGKYDVLHSLLTDTLLFGPPAGKLAGIRNVVTSERNEFDWKLRFPKRLLATLVNHLCTDRIIVNSRAIGERLAAREHLRRSRIFVIPNGIEVKDRAHREPTCRSKVRAELKARFSGVGDGPLLAMVGSLLPLKDHPTVINALAQVARTKPDVTLLIVGDGRERDSLRRQATDLGVEDHIVWTGRLIDVTPIYESIDLLILASKREGFPNVVIEALAHGVPVISTDLPYLLDLGDLRFGVRAFPKGGGRALCHEIEASLADKSWRELVRREAPEIVQRDFGLHAELERHLEVYRDEGEALSLERLDQRALEYEQRP